MSPQTLFVVTVAISLLNGMMSPATGLMFGLWPLWYPPVITPVSELIYYGASLLVSTGTLLLAAIPAAMAERLGASQTATMGAWLGAAGLLLLLGIG